MLSGHNGFDQVDLISKCTIRNDSWRFIWMDWNLLVKLWENNSKLHTHRIAVILLFILLLYLFIFLLFWFAVYLEFQMQIEAERQKERASALQWRERHWPTGMFWSVSNGIYLDNCFVCFFFIRFVLEVRDLSIEHECFYVCTPSSMVIEKAIRAIPIHKINAVTTHSVLKRRRQSETGQDNTCTYKKVIVTHLPYTIRIKNGR